MVLTLVNAAMTENTALPNVPDQFCAEMHI